MSAVVVPPWCLGVKDQWTPGCCVEDIRRLCRALADGICSEASHVLIGHLRSNRPIPSRRTGRRAAIGVKSPLTDNCPPHHLAGSELPEWQATASPHPNSGPCLQAATAERSSPGLPSLFSLEQDALFWYLEFKCGLLCGLVCTPCSQGESIDGLLCGADDARERTKWKTLRSIVSVVSLSQVPVGGLH